MGRIDLVLAVNSAGGDDAYRQRHGLHRADLHGARLRAEHHAAVGVKIKGVRPIAGGVTLLGVELVEVIACKLDLGTVKHGEAHADENVLDLVQRLIHRVLVTEADLLAGNGDVKRLKLQTGLKSRRLKLFAGLVYCLLKLCADLVCKLTHNGALLRGELAHLLQNRGQLTLFAEIFNSQRVKIFRTVSGENSLNGAFSELIHEFFHCVSPYHQIIK